MLRTHLTTQWGLRYPIVGAPMANTARGSLARAISAAGGLGMIGVGPRDGVELIEQESEVPNEAGVRFGIGLMAWVLESRPELLDAAIAQRPFLISISFGSIRPYADRVHREGIRLATQVNNRQAAVAAAEQGADLIIAQGTEAGGHTGRVATLPLLQILLETVNKPVGAAGGIASPFGLAAVLAAGAECGWIGTAFLLSEEANVTSEARRRITDAAETETILTSVFDRVNNLGWPPQYPGRALRNSFAAKWSGRESDLLADRDEVARFRRGADAKDYDVTSIYAGEAVGLLRRPGSARDVVERLGEGAERILRERAKTLFGSA